MHTPAQAETNNEWRVLPLQLVQWSKVLEGSHNNLKRVRSTKTLLKCNSPHLLIDINLAQLKTGYIFLWTFQLSQTNTHRALQDPLEVWIRSCRLPAAGNEWRHSRCVCRFCNPSRRVVTSDVGILWDECMWDKPKQGRRGGVWDSSSTKNENIHPTVQLENHTAPIQKPHCQHWTKILVFVLQISIKSLRKVSSKSTH